MYALEIADCNVRVDLRRRQRLVTDELLDVADVGAGAQHRRCAIVQTNGSAVERSTHDDVSAAR